MPNPIPAYVRDMFDRLFSAIAEERRIRAVFYRTYGRERGAFELEGRSGKRREIADRARKLRQSAALEGYRLGQIRAIVR